MSGAGPSSTLVEVVGAFTPTREYMFWKVSAITYCSQSNVYKPDAARHTEPWRRRTRTTVILRQIHSPQGGIAFPRTPCGRRRGGRRAVRREGCHENRQNLDRTTCLPVECDIVSTTDNRKNGTHTTCLRTSAFCVSALPPDARALRTERLIIKICPISATPRSLTWIMLFAERVVLD